MSFPRQAPPTFCENVGRLFLCVRFRRIRPVNSLSALPAECVLRAVCIVQVFNAAAPLAAKVGAGRVGKYLGFSRTRYDNAAIPMRRLRLPAQCFRNAPDARDSEFQSHVARSYLRLHLLQIPCNGSSCRGLRNSVCCIACFSAGHIHIARNSQNPSSALPIMCSGQFFSRSFDTRMPRVL